MSLQTPAETSRPRSFLAISLVAAFAWACGDGGGSPATPVGAVTVTPNPATVEVGSTVQLTAALEDANGNSLTGRTVTWTTDAAGVATVNGSGLVSGVAIGSAKIAATSEGKSDTATVTVTAATSEPLPPGTSAPLFTALDKTAALSNLYYALNVNYVWSAILELNIPPAPGGGILFNALTGAPASVKGGGRVLPVTRSVLYTGGYANTTGSAATTRAVLFDPATNQGTDIQMNDARIYHTTTLLPVDKALVAGGFDGDAVLATAEVFDETTKEFTATASMGVARGRHAAAALAGGRVLVTGGLVPVGAGPTTIDDATAEIFDPATGLFTPTGDMTVARFNHSTITLDDGRVLVLGGNGKKSAEAYDPVAGTFSAVGDMAVVHGLGHKAVKLLDGRVLVIGGDTGNIQPTAAVEIFDPATDQFTRVADMSTPRMLHFAVLLEDNGTVLVGGGQNDTGDLLASVERYDPVADTWTPTADMPFASSEQVAVFVVR
jgi:Bacterial Ig-like domain (group 2)/Galactose oxidase, central domain/Kelch motif